MPTCGECALLVRNKAEAYICAGKLTQCLDGNLTPRTDASLCLRFERKEPKKTDR